MDLDDELRRMFAASGDKLDVPVRADAEETIVAGAQRIRRRRLATMTAAGAAAVVTVVAVGIALTLPNQEATPPALIPPTSTSATTESAPPTSAPPPTSEAPPVAPPTGDATGTEGGGEPPDQTTEEPPPEPEVTGRQLGASGFLALELGMSAEAALATGMISEVPSGGSCPGTSLLIDGQPSGTVYFGDKGLQIIAPTVAVHTVDGVSVGWTLAQFVARYPDEQGAAENGEALLAVPGNPDAIYRVIFANDEIQRIQLQMVDMICD